VKNVIFPTNATLIHVLHTLDATENLSTVMMIMSVLPIVVNLNMDVLIPPLTAIRVINVSSHLAIKKTVAITNLYPMMMMMLVLAMFASLNLVLIILPFPVMITMLALKILAIKRKDVKTRR